MCTCIYPAYINGGSNYREGTHVLKVAGKPTLWSADWSADGNFLPLEELTGASGSIRQKGLSTSKLISFFHNTLLGLEQQRQNISDRM